MSENAVAVYTDVEMQRPADFKSGFQLLPVEQQEVVLAEYSARRTHFRKWLLSQLREGIHYGFPPGCEARYDNQGNVQIYIQGQYRPLNPRQWVPKPSLYKAGALYLVDLLKLKAVYSSDLDAWRMMGEPKGTLVRTCKLVNPASGEVIGEGTGTYEVGKKKMDSNAAIKMADKTAVVAAVINTLAIADLFTQDIEEKPHPANISPEMEAGLADLVQAWTSETFPQHRVTSAEIRALRANLSIWCKGKVPETPDAMLEWARANVEISEMLDAQTKKPTGIRFILRKTQTPAKSKTEPTIPEKPPQDAPESTISGGDDDKIAKLESFRQAFAAQRKEKQFIKYCETGLKFKWGTVPSDFEFAVKSIKNFAKGQKVNLE